MAGDYDRIPVPERRGTAATNPENVIPKNRVCGKDRKQTVTRKREPLPMFNSPNTSADVDNGPTHELDRADTVKRLFIEIRIRLKRIARMACLEARLMPYLCSDVLRPLLFIPTVATQRGRHFAAIRLTQCTGLSMRSQSSSSQTFSISHNSACSSIECIFVGKWSIVCVGDLGKTTLDVARTE